MGLIGCSDDDDDDEGVAPEEAAFGGFTVVFMEEGGPTNRWAFSGQGASGTATLEGASDFPYTYEKTGSDRSVLIFDVGGNDRYEMKWTSSEGGTFEESFEGEPGNNGEFYVEL